MITSSEFSQFLQRKNISMEEIHEEDGFVFFRRREAIENGGNVLLIVAFNESSIDFRVYDIADIQNPLKKEAALQLINELNMTYRYSKFTINEGRIDLSYSLSKHFPADAQDLFDILVMLLDCASDTYPKFMKVQWS
ncbi:MAG: YbjN domain-containing protein [Paenibacillus sp.]|jgi:hypothetical protein|nr:YbjN domain-containing protein [Paenibacillus sp.]MDU2239952.1 YbjN domain-containing protein [Paenibacillus sp.]